MNERELSGLTVNERLFALGVLDDFDSAMAIGDRNRVKAILQRALVDPLSIERIVGRVATQPAQSNRVRAARG